MNILDNKNTIKKYDPDRVLESLELLPAQISDTKIALESFSLPPDYKNVNPVRNNGHFADTNSNSKAESTKTSSKINNVSNGVNKIILCGMGGSALGAYLLKAAFFDSLKVPFEIAGGYRLPGSVDSKTLLILSSYSGGTEEVLSVIGEARRRGAKIVGIAAATAEAGQGGKLAELLKKDGLPIFVFNTKDNPSGQPRMGLGYALFGLWGILAKLGLLTEPKWSEIILAAKSAIKKWGLKSPANNNCAKWLAKELQNKLPVLVTSGFLDGNGHIFANQINETAKQFVAHYPIPELNHHLMEGLQFPAENKKLLYFVFLESALYPKRIKQRFAITKKVLTKNKIKFTAHEIESKNVAAATIEALIFGSYASFYLAMLNRVNPAIVPWVDFFKKELDKI